MEELQTAIYARTQVKLSFVEILHYVFRFTTDDILDYIVAALENKTVWEMHEQLFSDYGEIDSNDVDRNIYGWN